MHSWVVCSTAILNWRHLQSGLVQIECVYEMDLQAYSNLYSVDIMFSHVTILMLIASLIVFFEVSAHILFV